MSARRFSRLQKATALVPLAVLSAAWTANVTDLVPNPVAVAANRAPARATLPDGSPLPTTALKAPASISAPSDHSEPVGTKDTGDVITAVSATGIPAAALSAYQRAATVINDADKACHLDWPLLAAIGRVESNHGRVGGSRLTTAGIATPAILGPALTGRHGTSRVVDTDAGAYDGNRKLDRAVGPMQFLPSTWAIVGVDGDGDGKRNPQDINDAALATAVYLCSGSDLSTLAGQRAAVYRYNHSHPYVATVLGVAAAYRAGDYTSVPTDIVPAGDLIVPSTEPLRVPAGEPPAPPSSRDPRSAGRSGSTAIPLHADATSAAGSAPAAPAAPSALPSASGSTSASASGATSSSASTTASASAPPPASPSSLPASPSASPTASASASGSDSPTQTSTIPTESSSKSTAPASQAGQTDPPPTDTTAPDAPTITGTPTVGDTTVSGTGEPGATVTVLVKGTTGGTATVGPEGEWTVNLGTALAAGDDVTATQTDAADNVSPQSEQVAVAEAATDDSESGTQSSAQ